MGYTKKMTAFRKKSEVCLQMVRVRVDRPDHRPDAIIRLIFMLVHKKTG